MNNLYPDGYVIETITLPNGKEIDEHNFYHVLFVKIIPAKGQYENTVVPSIQKFGSKDFAQLKGAIEKFDIGATQYDEYAVIHDPKAWKAEAVKKAEEAKKEAAKKETKVKPGPKPAKVESQN